MQVTTRDIPTGDWQAYFTDLSKEHRGWSVAIEVLGRDLGDQPMVRGLPLQGISYESRGSEAGDILIEVGDTPDEYMVHHVDRARSARTAVAEPGERIDLQFVGGDGVTTLVELRRRPELPGRGARA